MSRTFRALYALSWLIAGLLLCATFFSPGFSYISHYSDIGQRFSGFILTLYLASAFVPKSDRWYLISFSAGLLAIWLFDLLLQSLFWAFWGDPIWGRFPFRPEYLIYIPLIGLYAACSIYAWRRRRFDWAWSAGSTVRKR